MIGMVATKYAPQAVGPYSQAVKFRDLLFCSGQVSINPETGEIEKGTVAEQTKRILQNLAAVLAAGDSDLSLVLKTTVYLSDMANFAEMNEVYASYFQGTLPARLTVEVKSIYAGLAVEIDAIAATRS